MKAVWSEDIVMEGIWWQDIRMKASDFRGGRPPYQTMHWWDHQIIFTKALNLRVKISDHSEGCSWICISLGGSSLSNHAPLGQILLFRQWSTVTYDHIPTKKVKDIPLKSITFFKAGLQTRVLWIWEWRMKTKQVPEYVFIFWSVSSSILPSLSSHTYRFHI